MDLKKLKKDVTEKGIEEEKDELGRLKSLLGKFNSGQVNASTTPQGDEVHVGPATEHNSGQMANSGQTGTTPVMDSGKTDVREPETPRRQEEIREPSPEEEDKAQQAAAQRRESHREAAIEENPPRDSDSSSEDAA